jgi:uncharacterized membrane protein
MTHDRLHALTDGVFAIAMTLMVFQIKLPVVHAMTNASLWQALRGDYNIFSSYFISFALLFVYWRAHNFIITILAKNISIDLLSINGVFLFLVGLIPFSTQLAGTYNKIPLAISLYAANIVAIGLTLWLMRTYIEISEKIENIDRTDAQRRAALIRTLLPVGFAMVAIPLSFMNTDAADIVLLLGVGFNFLRNAAEVADKFLITPVGKIFAAFG